MTDIRVRRDRHGDLRRLLWLGGVAVRLRNEMDAIFLFLQPETRRGERGRRERVFMAFVFDGVGFGV